MEEMHRARYVKRAQSFHALASSVPLSPNLHTLTTLEALQTSWGFPEASLHKHDILNYCPLVIDSNFNSPIPGNQGEGWPESFPGNLPP